MAKASRIIGVDIDPAKFETGKLAVGKGGRGGVWDGGEAPVMLVGFIRTVAAFCNLSKRWYDK
jgi:hypothetical protein